MKRRKLQVFLSSTYEDLIEHRLAAMEAILAAGHIPAAMEQFSPGDETAWEKIRDWIDESDAFILILGGRYGSLEPESGKSFVQLEYEYVMEKKKPFFALVVHPSHHEERVKQFGLSVDERERPAQYAQFRELVTSRLCRFWSDRKDIQTAVLQKLPEWTRRADLAGWIRAEEAPTAEVANELARLSTENRDLRSQLSATQGEFDGFRFEELAQLLRQEVLEEKFFFGFNRPAGMEESHQLRHAGHLFEIIHNLLPRHIDADYLRSLIRLGLVDENAYPAALTDLGRRFRARMLLKGDVAYRLEHIWSDPPPEEVASAGE